MKKLLAVILSFLYISSSTGVTVHMHYCMGKLADWGLGHNESQTCGRCGMEKSDENKNGCCKDEQQFVKNNSDQRVADPCVQFIQLLLPALAPTFIDHSMTDLSTVAEEYAVSHAPPRSTGVAVYLRNRVFLI